MSRVWFITGASTGFGRVLAEAVLARGERVVATARNVESVKDLADRAFVARLDVTEPESIRSAVDAALAEYGQIDVLVNNAGHGLIGALEELTDEQTREVLETNVFGVLAVTRAVLPHLRERRSGHIVQLSSVGGVVGNPGHAIYATSKFALEGMSEALAGEVAPLGIRVSIVEPGPFRTEFAGRSMRFADPIADYRETPAGRLREHFAEQDGRQPNDPARAAAAILKLVDTPDAPLRLPLGPEAVTRIRAKLEKQLADLAEWEAYAVDTRYPGA
jgi:NAD(P)-dependent dehydrogenase (short-subunit alcohol dehydrogenase family)